MCWTALELLNVKYAATQLSLTLLLVLNLVGLFFGLELDFLGTFILATYSSVFIALSLLSLHFGPFWMPARLSSEPRGLGVWGLVSLLGLASCLAALFFQVNTAPANLGHGWVFSVLWQDLFAEASTGLWSLSAVLHWLFYKLMWVETLALNLYLFAGLVGAVTILTLRQLWQSGSSQTLSSRAPAQLGALG